MTFEDDSVYAGIRERSWYYIKILGNYKILNKYYFLASL
jgi:hypothetical protein